MNYQEIYTYAENHTQHIIGVTKDEPENLVRYCCIDIYGIPQNMNDREVEAALEDKNLAVHLGKIKGYLIWGDEIYNRGEDMYILCDDVCLELEYVVSALMENAGPLNDEYLGGMSNHFYIEDIELKDKSIFDKILQNIDDIIFTHCYVRPDIISCNPAPLPHERSMKDVIIEDMAMLAYAETLKRDLLGKSDESETQLIMSDEQLNIAMGRRPEGATYPKEYINHDIWDRYINAGFEEWRNTRVLYIRKNEL